MTTDILLGIAIFLLALIAALLIARMVSKRKRDTPANKYNPNTAAVIRDVLISANQSGQFPLAIAALVVIIAFVVMGADYVHDILLQSINTFKTFGAIGWILFIITVVISSLSVRKLKKHHTKEIEFLKNEYLKTHYLGTQKEGEPTIQKKQKK